jgi:phospholipid/cholesterol/gamma-HCH transport system substrate-binding protein
VKNNSINYVVVGVFVIAMLAAAVTVIAALSGRTGPTDAYVTAYGDVSGIKFGTKVLYMGFPVGQVEGITPEWNSQGDLVFKLNLSVSTDWRDRIPTDSVAEIRAGGLLAAVALDIRRGESKASLKPGDEIAGLERSDLFTAMTAAANTVNDLAENNVKPLIENVTRYVDNFGSVLERDGSNLVTDLSSIAADLSQSAPEIIDNYLGLSREIRGTAKRLQEILGPENSSKIGRILDNAELATGNVAALTADERIKQTITNVEAASQHLAVLTKNANTRLEDVFGERTVTRVRTSLDNIALAAKNVAELSRDLRDSRQKLEHFIDTLDKIANDNRPDIRQSVKDLRHAMDIIDSHIETIAYNLEGTSRNMREFSRALRQNPGALLGGKPPSDSAGN